MIIKINELLQYEVSSAIKTQDKVVAIRADGTEITITGDLENIEIIGGEITSTPTEEEKRDAQIFYTAMMTDTLLEEV